MTKLFMDIHIIQTVPPSCVNRDDTGSPKTATYGGVQRARVSSQSWKRAMRGVFKEHFNESELGLRTKKILDLVADAIVKLDASQSSDGSLELAEKVVGATGVQTKDGESKALFFMSRKQADNLAKLATSEDFDSKSREGKTKAKEALREGTAVDTAFFGRMVADDPSLNTDASSQVAHALSTHQVDNEYDYFTAVDDCSPEDSAGAGMIGTIEYNSSTLYRYATVAIHELNRELAACTELTAKAVMEFARAFATSMPDGKKNTFANATPPDMILVCLREDQPINLVGAFENPIQSREGFAKKSVQELCNYANGVYDNWYGRPSIAWAVSNDCTCAETEKLSFFDLLAAVQKEVAARLSNEE